MQSYRGRRIPLSGATTLQLALPPRQHFNGKHASVPFIPSLHSRPSWNPHTPGHASRQCKNTTSLWVAPLITALAFLLSKKVAQSDLRRPPVVCMFLAVRLRDAWGIRIVFFLESQIALCVYGRKVELVICSFCIPLLSSSRPLYEASAGEYRGRFLVPTPALLSSAFPTSLLLPLVSSCLP